MNTIGLFPNSNKVSVAAVLAEAIRFFARHQVDVLLPEEEARLFGYEALGAPPAVWRNRLKAALTLGGDGTLLGTCRRIAALEIPICGINMGHLGFLAEIERAELTDKLTKLVYGDYYVEERLMLDAAICRGGGCINVAAALNDIVVTKGAFARMLRMDVKIDQVVMRNYRADGLILATSTGSTGYSLSAGGPIVHPSLPVMLITPICPHTLSARPLVISAAEPVCVKVDAPPDGTILTVDGQVVQAILPEDEIIVQKSARRCKFIKFNDKNYYHILQAKLWRGN